MWDIVPFKVLNFNQLTKLLFLLIFKKNKKITLSHYAMHSFITRVKNIFEMDEVIYIS